MQNGSRKQIERMFNEILNHLASVEDDLNYHEFVLDGSWPNCIPILKAAIAKAEKSLVYELLKKER